MEKLDKAYEGMEMLRNIGLPISKDQIKGIYDLEAQYLTEEVIPKLKEVMDPLVHKVMNGFKMVVTVGEQEEVNVELLPPETENTVNQRETNSKKRQKNKVPTFLVNTKYPRASRLGDTLYKNCCRNYSAVSSATSAAGAASSAGASATGASATGASAAAAFLERRVRRTFFSVFAMFSS